jgi:hypothetical protein
MIALQPTAAVPVVSESGHSCLHVSSTSTAEQRLCTVVQSAWILTLLYSCTPHLGLWPTAIMHMHASQLLRSCCRSSSSWQPAPSHSLAPRAVHVHDVHCRARALACDLARGVAARYGTFGQGRSARSARVLRLRCAGSCSRLPTGGQRVESLRGACAESHGLQHYRA